jgi:alpha-1,2-mannosyltransferase
VRCRSIRPIWQVGAASLLGVAGLMVYNTVAFGGPFELVGVWAEADDRIGGLTASSLAENVLGTFFSPSRGVLVLSPFLVLLLPGVFHAWRVAPSWVRASAAGGAFYLAVHTVGNYFAGGEAFYSYRYPIEWLTLAAPLLVLCWVTWTSARPWRRAAFAALAWFAVFQHAVGAITYNTIDFHGYEAWDHYLLIDGLRQGTPLGYAILLLVSAVAGWVTWRLARSRQSSIEEGAQAGDRVVPAPALLDPLPAPLAHPLGEDWVEQERAEPVRDR